MLSCRDTKSQEIRRAYGKSNGESPSEVTAMSALTFDAFAIQFSHVENGAIPEGS